MYKGGLHAQTFNCFRYNRDEHGDVRELTVLIH
jgi:hypothetical protein